MPTIPIVPVALVASLGALFYMDKEYKKIMAVSGEETKQKKLKKYRMGLMVSSGALALLIIVNTMTKRSATSSFENRVANAANTLRSSCNLQGPVSSAQPSDDFSARVSEAAAELRKQIAGSSANLSSMQPNSASDLAAKASAEISQFIADNS